MRVVGIHHLQLAMPPGGEKAAIRFYEGILGVPSFPKPDRLAARGGCWFESATVRIHLGVEPGFAPARKAHPALLVEDLTGLRHRLEEAGIVIDDGQPLTGFERFYVSDPFGNRLEFLEPIAATDR